jgi:carboxyl-terminal processing protease
MKRSILFFMMIILTLSWACKKEKQEGPLIGIRVPTGDEKVSREKPYVVHEVIVDSPAHKAGVNPDDIIVQIDGVKLEGLTHGYVYDKLVLGEKGTPVVFTIQRDGETKIIQLIRGGR